MFRKLDAVAVLTAPLLPAPRLIADAERVARSITDKSSRAWALARIAETVAATDPDRAERIAQSITDKRYKALALATVATALAATDPDRAERIAQSITEKASQVSALVSIARIGLQGL